MQYLDPSTSKFLTPFITKRSSKLCGHSILATWNIIFKMTDRFQSDITTLHVMGQISDLPSNKQNRWGEGKLISVLIFFKADTFYGLIAMLSTPQITIPSFEHRCHMA